MKYKEGGADHAARMAATESAHGITTAPGLFIVTIVDGCACPTAAINCSSLCVRFRFGRSIPGHQMRVELAVLGEEKTRRETTINHSDMPSLEGVDTQIIATSAAAAAAAIEA